MERTVTLRAVVLNNGGIMRYFAFCCCAIVLVGCTKPDQQAAKDTTATASPAPEPAAQAAEISLADVAGKWAMTTRAENSDSVLVRYELVATGDTTGWTINFPKRKPVPTHVTVNGDSLVLEAGPFESVLRKGVQVRTRSVARLQDGKLVGTTVARYATKGPDTLRTLRMEGTRAQ
jgi:hypothetical protein